MSPGRPHLALGEQGNTHTTDHCCRPLMTAEDLAEHLVVPIATLYAWRSRGQGPPAIKVGRWLRYRRSDVEAWLTKQSEVA